MQNIISNSMLAKVTIVITIFLSLTNLFAQETKEKDILNSLDNYYQKALTDWEVPGMAVAIVKNNEVIFMKGYGVRDIKDGGKVDKESLFAIASLSKAFTSAAIAILVDEGKLKWDDKVRTYLPYFELYDPYVSENMTIRDLLCHRSGLETFSGDLLWFETVYNREEIIRRAKYLKPVYGFRSNYGYSNIMFLTAGEVIAKVSGMTWDDFIQERFRVIVIVIVIVTPLFAIIVCTFVGLNDMEEESVWRWSDRAPVSYSNW